MMTQQEQQQAFSTDMLALITRYRSEFDLTLSSAIGVMEVLKSELMIEIYNDKNPPTRD